MRTDPMLAAPTTSPASTRRRTVQRTGVPTQLRMMSSGLSDQGLSRHSNQDRFLIAPFGDAQASRGASGHLFAVADGVGGVNGGEVASTLTMETIQEVSIPALQRLCQSGAPERTRMFSELRKLFHAADARVLAEAGQHEDLVGMSTTLTVAVTVGSTLYVAHAGDSRCYLLRSGTLRRLTVDHTVAQEMVRHGLIEADHVARHPYRHVLSNFIGIGEAMLEVEVHEAELGEGDGVLLCSDGLTGMLPSPLIAAIMLEAPNPEVACHNLIARANDLGGYDNVTAIVAKARLRGS
jgi:serine/threonine protein phosphatase PrpC